MLACQERWPRWAKDPDAAISVTLTEPLAESWRFICNRYFDVQQTALLALLRVAVWGCQGRERLCLADNWLASFVILDSSNKAVAPFLAFHSDGWCGSCSKLFTFNFHRHQVIYFIFFLFVGFLPFLAASASHNLQLLTWISQDFNVLFAWQSGVFWSKLLK